MAAVSRPILYGGLAALSIALLWATSSEPAKAGKTVSRKGVVRKGAQDWTFPAAETKIRFDKPEGGVRNVFRALVEPEEPLAGPEEEEEELMKLPATFADGEADWAYTGMVEVDGTRLALMENMTTHQGGYVREGETWKKSRIVRITMANVLFAGPEGKEETIVRYNANAVPKPKPLPDAGFRPMDLSPALRGPIGLEISRSDVKSMPSAVKKEVNR